MRVDPFGSLIDSDLTLLESRNDEDEGPELGVDGQRIRFHSPFVESGLLGPATPHPGPSGHGLKRIAVRAAA